MGIDNCRVEVDGPEIPILDGSAAPFVCLVQEAGVQVQRVGKRWLVIDQPIEIKDGDKRARLEPSEAFSVEFTADFNHPLITNQAFRVTLGDRAFEREVARARTFCFRRDIERMQAAGLAKGGSLENAIVVDDFSILNPEGLRFPDEFARHKVLDAIGDLALFGVPVLGALTAVKSGHALNQALVRKVLADPSSHRVVRVSAEAEVPRARGVPALLPEGQVA
jgi:UDP-3-O-[3-hydroxymyristoyl] N-acetylglucosamine deacetylase